MKINDITIENIKSPSMNLFLLKFFFTLKSLQNFGIICTKAFRYETLRLKALINPNVENIIRNGTPSLALTSSVMQNELDSQSERPWYPANISKAKAENIIISPDMVKDIIKDRGVFICAFDVSSDKNMLEPPPENASIPKITPKKNGLNENFIPENEKSGDLNIRKIILIDITNAISMNPAISVYLIDILKLLDTTK